MNIKLLGLRVLIEADKAETKTASGLIISKIEEGGDAQLGRVVAVGEGKNTDYGEYLKCDDVSVGDRVMYQYGMDVMVDGKTYKLVNEADVIMVIK